VISSTIKFALKSFLKMYKVTISPAITMIAGPRCRFFPTCSEYATECVDKYPLTLALSKTSGRLMRCHPWHPGGVDLP
jgi:putative membrane protein insertion efficiency factor